MGEKKEEEASRIFTVCSLLIVASSCLIGLVGVLGAEAMLQILGADAAVAALGGYDVTGMGKRPLLSRLNAKKA